MRALYWSLIVLCAALTVLPLWLVAYPPLVDLPQNVAQLSIGERWDDPQFGYPEIYRENRWLAHRLAPWLVNSLGIFLPLLPAVKVALSMALLGIPLAVGLLIRETRGDPWWVFAVFPTCYSFSFLWGFLSFAVATPIALIMILAAVRYARAPSRGRALVLAALGFVLFFGHTVLLAFAGLASLAIVLARCRGVRERWIGAAALAATGPLVAVWLVMSRLGERSTTAAPNEWRLTADRLLEVLGQLVGMDPSLSTTVMGLALLATPLLIGGRPSRKPYRWIVLALAAALFLLAPFRVLGTAFLNQRFAVFLVPGLILAFDRLSPSRALWRRLVLPAIALLWLATLALYFSAFDRESAPFRALLDRMEPGKRVLSLVYYPVSSAAPYFPYLHFANWYQVEKGGVVDFSFAEFWVNRYRYRPEHDPRLPDDFEWRPGLFDWQEHGGSTYDYVLLRANDPRVARGWQTQRVPEPITLLGHGGGWYLFARPDGAATPALPSSSLP